MKNAKAYPKSKIPNQNDYFTEIFLISYQEYGGNYAWVERTLYPNCIDK